MNIPGTESLILLLERERADRDAAALGLRQAQGHSERIRQQLVQFEQHRAHFAARWNAEFTRSGGIEIVHCYRNFLQRIEQATGQLRMQRTYSEAAIQRAQELLADCERRVAAIEKLIERRAEQHRQRLHRQEQKLTDEAAQRSAWRSMGSSALASAVS